MHNIMHAHGLGSRKGCAWPCLEAPAFEDKIIIKLYEVKAKLFIRGFPLLDFPHGRGGEFQGEMHNSLFPFGISHPQKPRPQVTHYCIAARP